MSNKTLFVFGDSYSANNPRDNDCWSNHFSKKVNFNLQNFSIAGCSNYQIFNRCIYNINNLNEDSLVVIGWSFPIRLSYWHLDNDYQKAGKHYESINSRKNNKFIDFYETLNDKSQEPIARKIYKLLLQLNPTTENYYIETINYMISLSGLLKSKNCPHMFLNAVKWEHTYNSDFNPLNQRLNFLSKNKFIIDPREYGFIDDAINCGYRHTETRHINEISGYQYIADCLIEKAKELEIL